jgi:hypothetical protein
MGYPDQVQKLRLLQDRAIRFDQGYASRLQQAQIYVGQRYAYARPGPADAQWQAIQAWVAGIGERPW